MNCVERTEDKFEGNENPVVDLYYEIFERETFPIQTVGEFSSTQNGVLKKDEGAVDGSETDGSDQHQPAEHFPNNGPEVDFEKSLTKLRNTIDPDVHNGGEVPSESQVSAEKDLPNAEQLDCSDLEVPDSPLTYKDGIHHSDSAQKREVEKRGEFEKLKYPIEENSTGKENMTINNGNRGERDDEVLSERQLSSSGQHKVISGDFSDFSDSNPYFSDSQPDEKGGIHQSDRSRTDKRLRNAEEHKERGEFGELQRSKHETPVRLEMVTIEKHNPKGAVGSRCYGRSKEHSPVNKLKRKVNFEDSSDIGKEPVLSVRINNRDPKTSDSRRSRERITDNKDRYRRNESSHSLERRWHTDIRRDRSRSSHADDKRKKCDRNSSTSRLFDDQLSKEEDVERVIQLKIKELEDLLKYLPEKSRAEYETMRSHIVTPVDGRIEKERHRERRSFKQRKSPRKKQLRANRAFDDCIVKREYRYEERIKLISPTTPRRKELKEILFPSKCSTSSIVSRENASCPDESSCEAGPLQGVSSSCKKNSTFTADSKGSKNTKNRRTLDELVVKCLSEQRNQVEELEDFSLTSISKITEYDADKTQNVVEDVSSAAHSPEGAIITFDRGIENTASTVSLGNTCSAVGPEGIRAASLKLLASSEPQEAASSSHDFDSKVMTHSGGTISGQPRNRWDQLTKDSHPSKQQMSLPKPQYCRRLSSIVGNLGMEKPESVSLFSAPIQETANANGEGSVCKKMTTVCKNYPKTYQTLGELLLGQQCRPKEKVPSGKCEENREKETMLADKVRSPSAPDVDVIAVCDMDIEEETDSAVFTVETVALEDIPLPEINVSDASISVSEGIDCSRSNLYSPQLDETSSVHMNHPPSEDQRFPGSQGSSLNNLEVLLGPSSSSGNIYCKAELRARNETIPPKHTRNTPKRTCNTSLPPKPTGSVSALSKPSSSAPPCRDLLGSASSIGNAYCKNAVDTGNASIPPKPTGSVSVPPKPTTSAPPCRYLLGSSSTSGNTNFKAAVGTGNVSTPTPASSAPLRLAPTDKSLAVCRTAITRAKSNEINCYAHIAVVPKDYPYGGLTKCEVDLLKHSLSCRLPLASKFNVNQSFGEAGALIFKCKDRSVVDWLWRVTPKIVPWPGAQLKPLVWKKLEISFEVPREFADKPWQVMYQKLTLQNPIVNPVKWQFLKFITKSAMKFAIFVIDVASFDALRNAEFKLYLGFSKVVCTLLEPVGIDKKPQLRKKRAASHLCTST